MKTNLLKITALSIALGVALIACDKTNSTITSSDQLANAVIDNQTANEQSESAYELVDDATFLPFGGRNFRETADITGGGNGFFPMLGMGWNRPWKGKDANCATVTKTVTNNVITIVYDFTAVAGGVCGETPVGGKMTISMPVKPDSTFSGTLVRTVTYDNLKRDSLTINGTHTITTTLANGKATSSEKLAKMSILNSKSGKTITYTSTRSRVVDNKGTLSRNDDEYSVTGSTNGSSSDGTTFSSNITKALITKNSCSDAKGFPVSGTEEIVAADGTKKIVDYGDGTCDLKYTETTNGVTVEKERTRGKGGKGKK
ncbi:hypothetical protein Emtol_2437 [Emticicia oligotrophica DSM 17448]|uniref:Lipoprotein n=1 Tax=Emticicia oligotrophica (strain DSM 17448 / CIP 109782 / MTCC 6937 / GPTSA100-15) TaxID=929562 RepID=A0ABM5N272_EMTOG|nr:MULTISPECIES: hypothetical protein [Emticicia]AFK03573.1 hypothetical protein Emtol_2437 [Emticicia oligotrophica DSM 17448]